MNDAGKTTEYEEAKTAGFDDLEIDPLDDTEYVRLFN